MKGYSQASRKYYAKEQVEEPVFLAQTGVQIVVALPTLTAGEHTVTFSIPESQPVHKSELNHWLVSAYFVWEL